MKYRGVWALLCLLLAAALLAGCGGMSASESETHVTETVGAEQTDDVNGEKQDFDEDDLNSAYSASSSTVIQLSGSTASISGGGAAISGNVVTITRRGTYILSGDFNGSVMVDAADALVRLVLENVSVQSSDGPAIWVKAADKTVLILPAGTTNILEDTAYYTATGDDMPSAALYSQEDLTINGSGTLEINANYNDAVTSKDDLKITDATLSVTSVDDGLIGRDLLALQSCTVNITCDGDGMKTTYDTDTQKGQARLYSGSYTIVAGADGIQSANTLTISDGFYEIHTGGGSINSSTASNVGQFGGFGVWRQNSAETEDGQSAKGLRATQGIQVTAGVYTLDCSDDAVHSNGYIKISGGSFEISSGDDGIHADSSLEISDGVIQISQSYEGLESAQITISDGNISVQASDDGLNIAGGKDSSSINGRPGQNSFASGNDQKLTISGGYLVVDASGDGLDANGSVYISGGTVIVYGPTDSGNGTIDYDGAFVITGGMLIGTGSADMAQNVSAGTTQNTVLITLSTPAVSNTVFSVQDAEGNEVATVAPPKQYQTILLSTPGLQSDKSYTVYTGGSSTAPSLDGVYEGGLYTGGSSVVTFIQSSIVTTAGKGFGINGANMLDGEVSGNAGGEQ